MEEAKVLLRKVTTDEAEFIKTRMLARLEALYAKAPDFASELEVWREEAELLDLKGYHASLAREQEIAQRAGPDPDDVDDVSEDSDESPYAGSIALPSIPVAQLPVETTPPAFRLPLNGREAILSELNGTLPSPSTLATVVVGICSPAGPQDQHDRLDEPAARRRRGARAEACRARAAEPAAVARTIDSAPAAG